MAASGRQRLGALVAAAAVLGWSPSIAAAETSDFTIKDSRIVESSGLAADPPGNVYWTVNDSGSGPVAYAVKPDGALAGTLSFAAQPTDTEAVALHKDKLYIADIGDNRARRDLVTVYRLDHPRPSGLTVGYRAYDFRYPDGAHDAETLLVSPSGRMFIVTKGVKGGIYRAPRKPSRSTTNTLKRVADAPTLITDGTFLPGGDRIALLSYQRVTIVDAKSYATVASAAIPEQPQAESLAVSLDGSSLLVGSEGKRSKVRAMPIPGAPSPSPTPSDSGEQDPPVDEEPSTGVSRAGTLLAIGLAGLVALVAGLIPVVVRRR